MPAPTTYMVKTAVFTPSGGVAVNLTNLINFDVSGGGSRISWSSDGAWTEQAQAMEAVEGRISLTSQDQSLIHSGSLQVGVSGSLVLTVTPRASGRGAASSGDKTITAADAMIESNREGYPHRGVDTCELSFAAVNADGDTYPIAYV